MAFTYHTKLKKPKSVQPTELEEQIAQHLFDLQNNATSNELKSQLKFVQIVGAREVAYSADGKKAIVIFVPVPQLKEFRNIHGILVEDLQKKMQGKHVVIVGRRKIMPKEIRNSQVKQSKRPRSRTMAAVHAALLEDVSYPAEIVDRRIRFRLDGTKLEKITLDAKEEANLEHKIETFNGVYKALTGKDVVYSFQEKQ